MSVPELSVAIDSESTNPESADSGWGRGLVVSSNAGSTATTGLNLNQLIGANTFYDAGFNGSRSTVGNIEAGHIWNLHESLSHVTSQIQTTQDAGPQTGDFDRHATWVGMVLGGRPVDAASEWQRGVAYGANLFSGAIATAWNGDPFTTAFNFNTSSFIVPYRQMMVDGVGPLQRTVDVVNSSWNTSDTSGSANGVFSRGIDALAGSAGTAVVFAAGNTGPQSGSVGGPAAGYNVITVSAVGGDLDAQPYDTLTTFSSRGLNEIFIPLVSNPTDVTNPAQGQLIPSVRSVVDIAAPGKNITSALYGGTTGGNLGGTDSTGGATDALSINIEGTSFAAPMVAGGISLMVDAARATFGDESYALDGRVSKSILQTAARKNSGWSNEQTLIDNVVTTSQSLDPGTGAGLLDLTRAWDVLMTGTADVSGANGGHVVDRGWDFGEVSESSANDYWIRNILPEGTTLRSTLNWFVDRGLTPANTTSEVSFDNLDLEVWLTDGSEPIRKVAESVSLYNNVEHLSFEVPESGLYMIRVNWSGELWDFANDLNSEQYGLSWYANGLAVGDDPTVFANASDILWTTSDPQIITAVFMDDDAINVTSIATGDLRVSGPGGFSETPELVDLTSADNGRVVTTRWRLSPTQKEWDSSDRGSYQIEVLANSVQDLESHFVHGGVVGQFEVSIADTIGADGYGYIANAVPFSFDDISTTGQAILVRADDESVPLSDAALGSFEFPFYGQNHKSLFVSSNGLITFGTSQTSFSNGNLNTSPAQSAIAVLWDDLEASSSAGRVFWQLKGAPGSQRLIIQWNRYQYYLATGEITFQAILHSDGRIEVNYSDLAGNDPQQDEGRSATLGIKAAGDSESMKLLVSQDDDTSLYVGSQKSVLIARAYDFGDAPLPYPVSLSRNGARHVAIGPMLGTSRDWQFDGIHSAGADDDDLRSASDEDGLVVLTPFQSGTNARIRLNVSDDAVADAWIDWNQDGDWLDPGEQVLNSQAVGSGPNEFVVQVPTGFTSDSIVFARFRVSSEGGLASFGPAEDGEVEDHAIAVLRQAWLQLDAPASELSEKDGLIEVTLSRHGADLSSPLIVEIRNNDPGELSTPLYVVIPAGEFSTTFSVVAVDDSLLDGSINVSITASSDSGLAFQSATLGLTVTDHEALSVIVDSATVMEHRGAGGRVGRVTRSNTDISQPLVVSLQSTDITEARVPSTVTIPAGAAFVDFLIDAIDDDVVDGPVMVRIEASEVRYGGGFTELIVRDNDGPWFRVDSTGGETIVSEQNSTDMLSVVLTQAPLSDVVLKVVVSDPTEVDVDQAELIFTALNWNQPQQLLLTGVDDALFDGPQTSFVEVFVDPSRSDSAYHELDAEVVSVVNLDNEPLPPSILLPLTDTRTSFPQLSWTPVPGAVTYEVWISNLTTNTARVVHETVPDSQYSVTTPLPLGRFRFWVRATLGNGLITPWSVPKSFNINTPPQLAAMERRQPNARPVLHWTSAVGAISTEVWIENRVTGEADRIRQTGISGTQYQLQADLPLGLYRAWIRQMDAGGRVAAWSSAVDWVITTPPTLTGPQASTFDQTPEFRWMPVSGARRYELVVEDMVTFATVIHQTVTGLTSYSPVSTLPIGLYRWRVRSMGDNGVIGDWSSSVQTFIGGRPVVTAPIGDTGTTLPRMEWSAVDGAVSYSIAWQRLDQAGQSIQINGVTANFYTPSTPLVPGRYRLWVRAISGVGQLSVWSRSVEFNVNI
ncbi:MAG: S8 family serine peptidase [Planctomyces sp.]|nr:S8 family serine peptidase [Planctomyces sp.]